MKPPVTLTSFTHLHKADFQQREHYAASMAFMMFLAFAVLGTLLLWVRNKWIARRVPTYAPAELDEPGARGVRQPKMKIFEFQKIS